MEIQEEIIKHKSLMARQEAELTRLKIKQELAEAEGEALVYETAEHDEESSFHFNPVPQLPFQKLPTLTPKIFKGEQLEFLRWESLL